MRKTLCFFFAILGFSEPALSQNQDETELRRRAAIRMQEGIELVQQKVCDSFEPWSSKWMKCGLDYHSLLLLVDEIRDSAEIQAESKRRGRTSFAEFMQKEIDAYLATIEWELEEIPKRYK